MSWCLDVWSLLADASVNSLLVHKLSQDVCECAGLTLGQQVTSCPMSIRTASVEKGRV